MRLLLTCAFVVNIRLCTAVNKNESIRFPWLLGLLVLAPRAFRKMGLGPTAFRAAHSELVARIRRNPRQVLANQASF